MFFILSIDFAAGVPQMPPPQTHASPVLRPVWQPELPHFLLPTPADRHPGSPVFSAPGILVIQGCRTDLIGGASTVNSSLPGLILEITMKSGEIDRRFKAFHL